MLLNPFQKAYEFTYFEHVWLAKSRLNWMIVTTIIQPFRSKKNAFQKFR